MPILNFTPADKLASTIVDAAWYTAELSAIDGPKASSSGKSVNFFTDFSFTDGPFAGKVLPVTFNTGMDRPSVLGTMQLMPHTYFLLVYAAAFGMDLAKVPDQVDTDSLLHKKIDIKVEKIISDGVVMNSISAFLPAGQGQNQKAPF